MQDATELYHQGVAHLDRDELDEAIVTLTEAIRLDPKSVAAYNCRGCAFDRKGDFDRAVADFTDVSRLTPEHFSGYHLRGSVYEKKGEKVKADADFVRRPIGSRGVWDDAFTEQRYEGHLTALPYTTTKAGADARRIL